jgi:Taurine catabolism dioxygenase TauD, TfdA family
MIMPLRLVPQAGPPAWTGAALTPADWMLPIGAEETAALEALVADPGAAVPPRLAALAEGVIERLEHGRGLVLLRGLPLDRLGPTGAEAVLLAFGARLGTALPQDAAGRRVVRLDGAATTAGRPRFQADPADAVALLCLRQAEVGGQVSLLSAPALHNALLRTDRSALAVLHAGLPHRVAAAPEGQALLPVFSTATGAFVGRCDHAALAEDSMTPEQHRALAALEVAAAAPGQALTVPLHQGDLLLRNPHLVWKQGLDAPPAATAPAAAEGAGARHLLRLWLAMPNSRALPECYGAVFGATAAGAPRGGVATAAVPVREMVGG